MVKALLIAHVIAGLFGLVIGPIAMYSPKRKGLHTQSGIIYFGLMTFVCVSAVVLSVLHWETSWWLLVVAVFSYSFCLKGFLAEKRRGPNWLRNHISGMLGSYLAMTTAFIVVNVGRIEFFNGIPNIVFWIIPTLIGTPLIKRTLKQYSLPNKAS